MSLLLDAKRFAKSWLLYLQGPRRLDAMYREMHAAHAFPGNSWRVHLESLRRLIPDLDSKRILDFGCGPLGGLSQELGDQVVPYDPYIEKYQTPPWNTPIDVVFSSDVLEHLPVDAVRPFLSRVHDCHPEYVFLNISTRAAFKDLPNGVNAHLTVKPADWWYSQIQESLGDQYEPILAECDMLHSEATLCFRRRGVRDATDRLEPTVNGSTKS